MSSSRFNFEVTQADIDESRINEGEGDSFHCMIARTIARTIPTSRRIEVDIQTIRWSDDRGRHVFLTPQAAASYIVAFDAGDRIVPFRFQVRDAIPGLQKRATSEAAQAAKQSRDKIRNERRRAEQAQAVLADPEAPADKKAQAAERVEEAPERIEVARSAHEDLKAAYKANGESISEERVSETKRRPAPRVSKGKRRLYGHRELRVNQTEGRTHYTSR